MGRLTTHVLNTMHGKPAANIEIELYSINGAEHIHVKTLRTNADGRCDGAILMDEEFTIGQWELVFHVGEYFKAQGVELAEPGFLDQVPVRFGIQDVEAHYHVPLLVSPWSYTTYRGS